MIDWTIPSNKVTDHFTVQECCWLPMWSKLHVPTPTEQANLIRTCELMEKVREAVQAPIRVHSMIRPVEYNKLVGGSPKSAHIQGLACDFSVAGTNSDDLRKFLLPRLEAWGCRMEDLPGASWLHLDLLDPKPPGGRRFFKP